MVLVEMKKSLLDESRKSSKFFYATVHQRKFSTTALVFTDSSDDKIISRQPIKNIVHSAKYDRPPRPRFPDLAPSQLPDLSKIDPILDALDASKESIIDPPFPTKRPSVVITAPETESDDTNTLSAITGLTSDEIRNLMKKTLVVKSVKNQTGKGRMVSMYALVVVGNGNGVAGFGEGKDEEAPTAIKKATNKAIKNLRYFERYDDRTIYHDIEQKFHATVIKFWARAPGFGIRTNHYVHEVCKCIGIHDISSKVYGSRNGMNVIKCTFEAFASQKLPEQIARNRGKNLFDVYHNYYGAL
ncbi:6857_t:CDS:2 [Acaulospora morrowiae]|uniref:Small ribosomal subunit protein uS5m n=1 Tax=Acaulospora morrowiae TaxID=94023 RepID=A0A9N8Z4S9_9GLOM|nr:6857_t:CDS:2 [Acaulospora morrowiae]